MRQFSAAQLAAAFISILLLLVFVACGGGSSSTSNPVTAIVMTPSSVSMNVGQVAKITGVTKNYAGSTIVADVSYSSSNPSLITVSPTGYVCAGIWDANYINCAALPGQTGVGQVTITAKSGDVSSTAPVFSHLQVDKITVNPPTGCVSVGGTPTYTAAAYNTTAPGCSPAIPCDVTPSVGPISFYSTDFIVMSPNSTTGVLTANQPGSTTIYASVAGLNSVPEPALVCPVVSILVHDASSTNTTFTLAQTTTQDLVADVIDSAGVTIRPTLSWSSVPSGVASVTLGTDTTVNSGTVTANTNGTTTVTVSCATPICNRNIAPAYSQNVVTVNVSGTTTTSIYAASTKSLKLIPIQSSDNTTQTAITLPYLPNSIATDSAGTRVFLGSANGIMTVTVNTGIVAVSTAAIGKIIAVSPNGSYLLVSDSTNGNLYLYNTVSSTSTLTQSLSSFGGAFTADSQSVLFLAPNQQLYDYTTLPSSSSSTLAFVPDAIDVSAQGGLAYVTGSALGAIDVVTTCNLASWQTLAATAPTLVKSMPNGTGAVVADSPAIDVVTTGAIPSGCPPTPQSTVTAYNLGFGNFTANQMFVSTDNTRAYILSNLNSVIGLNLSTLTPFSIALANGAIPTTGGVMINNAFVYVGGSDGNVHALNVSSGTDAAQISVGLQDPSGNSVIPDLVVVLPK